MNVLSLFSSGGIGDLAVRKLGGVTRVASELLTGRASLFKHNFPETHVITGDIWEKVNEIVTVSRDMFGQNLDIVLATPPCQGMSKNGQGKLLRGIRDGRKSQYDVRNQLIIPTMQVIKQLLPRIVFFENVSEMVNTVILDEAGKQVNVIEYIESQLGAEYVGGPEIIQFADYGIPQRRTRLITIYTRDKKLIQYFNQHHSFLPEPTHCCQPTFTEKRWSSVRNTIGRLPAIDGKNKKTATSGIPYHRVPVLDPKKYEWIRHTPPEKGAFDNQCVNSSCRFSENTTHGASRDQLGINRANGDTPLYCEQCGELLPRPYTVDKNGVKRIMAGYTSAYKRMAWDLPAPTLTTNLSYPSSDHKLHPEQNRVLSLYEAFLLHTLDQFEYDWYFEDGTHVPDTLIAEIIGESIPPLGIYTILKHLSSVTNAKVTVNESSHRQLNSTC